MTDDFDPRDDVEPEFVWDLLLPPGWEIVTEPYDQLRFPQAVYGQLEGLS